VWLHLRIRFILASAYVLQAAEFDRTKPNLNRLTKGEPFLAGRSKYGVPGGSLVEQDPRRRLRKKGVGRDG